MLQALQKQQKPLLVVVFVLIVISFGFLFNASDTGGLPWGNKSDPLAQAYVGNRAVYQEEVVDTRRQLEMIQILSLLRGPGGQGVSMSSLGAPQEIVKQQQLMGTFLSVLGESGPNSLENLTPGAYQQNQWLNLLAFREQAKAAGILFTEEEHRAQISAAVTRLPGLYSPFKQGFDEELLESLKATTKPGSLPMNLFGGQQIQLSNYGQNPMSLLRQAAADLLAFEALLEILEPAGLSSASFAQRRLALELAQTQVRVVEGKRDDFLPTDEEIDESLLQSWYQENSLAFQAPESRKVQLLIGKVVAEESALEGSDDLLSEDSGDLAATEITDAQWDELRSRFNRFFTEVVGTSQKPLSEAALEANLEILEIEGVNLESPPAPFADDPALLRLALQANTNPERLAEPLQERNRGRIVSLRVLEVTPPQPRELESVRERAVEAWRLDVAGRNLIGALEDTAAAMEDRWQEQGELGEFQPADERLSLGEPRFFDRVMRQELPLSANSFRVPVGKASSVMEIQPLPGELQLGDNPVAGFAFVTARRLTEQAQTQVAELPRDANNLSLILALDWLQQARREQELRLPGE